jgi:hypothetical protein
MMDLNTAEYGGGVYDDDGTVTLTGDMVMFNRASEEDGGGVYNDDGTATVTGGRIVFNTPSNCAGTVTGG